MGYMTTLIYSGVALVTGYQFLYDSNGMMTTWLSQIFPLMNKQCFSGFNAVLFTMTFACTSNHALFLRNAIRNIDYNTVEWTNIMTNLGFYWADNENAPVEPERQRYFPVILSRIARRDSHLHRLEMNCAS